MMISDPGGLVNGTDGKLERQPFVDQPPRRAIIPGAILPTRPDIARAS